MSCTVSWETDGGTWIYAFRFCKRYVRRKKVAERDAIDEIREVVQRRGAAVGEEGPS